MVAPVYLTLVCGDSASMTSLQDGKLGLFQGENGTEFLLLWQIKMSSRINVLLKIGLKFSLLSRSVMGIHFFTESQK